MVTIRTGALLGACLAMTSCGGESTTIPAPPVAAPGPAPSPTPTPTSSIAGATDRIIYAAAATQTFVSAARSFSDDYLSFRYDAATRFTLATGNYDTSYVPLVRAPGYTPPPGHPWLNFVRGTDRLFVGMHASGEHPDPAYRFIYSNLATWSEPLPSSFNGTTAFGIATAPGAGPTGAVTYKGFLLGRTSETYLEEGMANRGHVTGEVTLIFDPTFGLATITLSPRVETDRSFEIEYGTVDLSWARGAETFLQPVPGQPGSKDYPINGRFTGPAAEELIGSLAIRYNSPIDGSSHTAIGSFIAKR